MFIRFSKVKQCIKMFIRFSNHKQYFRCLFVLPLISYAGNPRK